VEKPLYFVDMQKPKEHAVRLTLPEMAIVNRKVCSY